MTKITSSKRALFIFRRDLRLEDNTALNLALSSGYSILPVFIVDPRQFEPHPYQSQPGLQFLVESLVDLNRELERLGSRLHLVRGIAEEVIEKLLTDSKCVALFFNRDYTPFSRQRDALIAAHAERIGALVQSCDDTLIDAPGAVVKDDGKPYTIYTPYYKKAIQRQAARPCAMAGENFLLESSLIKLDLDDLKIATPWNHEETSHGGRTNGLKALEQLSRHSAYKEERDFPAIRGTTRLSAHHKFGTISIRETLLRATSLFGRESTLVKELYWRDFFTQIAYHFPHVFERSFNAVYDQVKWHDNNDHLQAWCRGETGYPIVDAGMRELNQTGYMHNRVRMIVASFLTKDLHISWRAGERYFAQKLIDYDPCVNNGSWQWAASTGCDAQPYFRIFNPWLQQQKFDADCNYIKRWIPELRCLGSAEIHALNEKRPLFLKDYPLPIVEHSREKRITEELFNLALGR